MSAGGNSEKRNREGLKFSDELKAFVADLGDVQLMSLGAVDILRDLSRPDISGRAISNKIGQDPTLSARILRLANSSYYGVANRVSTVNQAVTLLSG